ncbi:MAG: PP2C family protein-serine/threonine phosphatase [Micromonosporaceae bacterium]
MIAVRWGSATHAGRVRPTNEDRSHAKPPVFVLADGMGGHAAGEVASQLAVDEFRRLTEPLKSADVRAAVDRANAAILDAAKHSESYRGMGTTLVALILVTESGKDRLLGVNLGDSRLYRCRAGALEQLSVDHSQAQELVQAGVITADERGTHPLSNVLTRALGHGSNPQADYWLLDPAPGDRFLLCSDGLTAELPDHRIRTVLSGSEGPDAAAAELVRLAVQAGGRDNVTTVVVDVAREARAPY